MSTSQEIQQAVFDTVKGVGRFTLALLKGSTALAKEVAKIMAAPSGGAVLGAVAGPLNSVRVKCPKCKASKRWEDA